ncbi:MAG: hypothetical protein AAB884_00185 [Patescibacteria group bacterium]
MRRFLLVFGFALSSSFLGAQDVPKRDWEAVADSLEHNVGIVILADAYSLDSLRNTGATCEGFFGKFYPDGSFSGSGLPVSEDQEITAYQYSCVKVTSVTSEKVDSNITVSTMKFNPLLNLFVDVRDGHEKRVLWIEMRRYNRN